MTILLLLQNVLAGATGALISFVVVYLLFISKGISIFQRNIIIEEDFKYLLNTNTLDEIKRIISNITQVEQQPLPVAKGKIMQQLLKDIRSKGDDDLKLYTFAGLEDKPIQSNNFQNFVIDSASGNVNAIYFLWADVGNEIKAKIEDEQGNKFLRVLFDNKSEGGSNIAIRPYAEKVHQTNKEMKYLKFSLRISKKNQNMLLGFRIVNGWLQHWHYSNTEDIYITLPLNDRAQFQFDPDAENSYWRSFYLDIKDTTKWHLFKGDGNHRYGPQTVDCSLISFVIFEFGEIPNGHSLQKSIRHRPGEGKGELDIRQIELTQAQGDFFII